VQRKVYTPELVKLTGDKGSVRAVFSLFNTIDADLDVTLPGAFEVGAETRIAQWGHNWSAPAIGRGVIGADAEKVWIDGTFFLNMDAGKETYEAVKGLGPLQQWSYGYDVLEAEPGEFEDRRVRFLKRVRVHEVSPVLLGSQSQTFTEAIKGAKLGARNSTADLARMARMAELLEEAQEILAELTTGAEPSDAGGKGAPAQPSALAAKVAAELLAMTDDDDADPRALRERIAGDLAWLEAHRETNAPTPEPPRVPLRWGTYW
jgi:HK97 family phage prohead protease